MKKVLKIIFIILLVLVILLAIGAGIIYFTLNGKLGSIKYDNINIQDIDISEQAQEFETSNEIKTIAILGIDTRNNTYEGSRSDCIIIATINDMDKTVSLISVYRDSYLEIPGYGLDKVTHAYAYGGPTLTLSTLNRNLDLNITEEVTVNFDATKEIIDSIDGIDLIIDDDEVKFITGINNAGKHHLNGSQALEYSRIRYASGGDHKRTQRMRTVLEAVFEKAKNMNISELYSLVDKLLPSVSTNIDKNEILKVIPKIGSYSIKKDLGWPYEVKGITFDRWYGVPVNLEENVIRLHKEVFEQEDYEASQTVKDISSNIIKKTGYR